MQHQAKTGHTDEAETAELPMEESFEQELVTYSAPMSERASALRELLSGIWQVALVLLNWFGDFLMLVTGGLFGVLLDAVEAAYLKLSQTGVSLQDTVRRYSRDFYCVLFLVQAGMVLFLFGLGLGRCLAVHLGLDLDHACVGAAVTLLAVRPARLGSLQKVA